MAVSCSIAWSTCGNGKWALLNKFTWGAMFEVTKVRKKGLIIKFCLVLSDHLIGVVGKVSN